MQQWKETTDMYINMFKSHKHNVEQKKSDTKRCKLYDSLYDWLYMELKKRQKLISGAKNQNTVIWIWITNPDSLLGLKMVYHECDNCRIRPHIPKHWSIWGTEWLSINKSQGMYMGSERSWTLRMAQLLTIQVLLELRVCPVVLTNRSLCRVQGEGRGGWQQSIRSGPLRINTLKTTKSCVMV